MVNIQIFFKVLFQCKRIVMNITNINMNFLIPTFLLNNFAIYFYQIIILYYVELISNYVNELCDIFYQFQLLVL
jgi:hypothetical protein